jgi:hypothetical protein
MNPPLSPLSKLFQTFSLTLSPLSPSLSLAMKSAFKKLASILFVATAYAIAGWAFFFVFFRSQF